jgi:hypothetical protein
MSWEKLTGKKAGRHIEGHISERPPSNVLVTSLVPCVSLGDPLEMAVCSALSMSFPISSNSSD